MSAKDQWTVHAYFRPSEDLSDVELLEHRGDITKRRPPLPQQAGKALRRMVHETVRPAVNTRGVYVSSEIVQPYIDRDKFARVIIDISRHWDDPKPRRPAAGGPMDDAELVRRFSPEHRRRQQDPPG